jgi:hypothetical protein
VKGCWVFFPEKVSQDTSCVLVHGYLLGDLGYMFTGYAFYGSIYALMIKEVK